eukprot:jgi/Bigna1/37415/e_gw1.19.155.1
MSNIHVGMFQIISKNGRIERKVASAHKGAVLTIKFNHSGTALMTGGEDGFVKKWSKTGNLQSKFCHTGRRAVYSLAWSPNGQSILYCSEKFLTIKPLSPSMKEVKWKAHEAIVLCVDWNPTNDLIVSGGEDCCYKIWDSFGRQVYASAPLEFTVTSLAWTPNGDEFALGSFNRIMLCDRHGWAHSSHHVDTGSIFSLSWTEDGTQVAGAGASGAVCFAQKLGQEVQWESLQATVKDLRQAHLRGEELEFSDRVVKVSVSHGFLIVVTQKACYVYKCGTFNLHHKFELAGAVTLLLQAKDVFLLASNVKGVQIFSTDGQLRCTPRAPGLAHPRFLKEGNISLASDVLAYINRSSPMEVGLLDTESGKPFSEPYKHSINVVSVALNHDGMANSRKMSLIDSNRDLYVTRLHRPKPVKLATMVESAVWHSRHDILACISHQRLVVWYYPHVVYVDMDLLQKTQLSIDASAYGKQCELVSFHGSSCTVQKANGARVSAPVSPFPITLVRYAARNKWPQCTRLCRFAKKTVLWACLAAVAMGRRQLEIAAVAFAALDEVDKLDCVQNIISIPSSEGQRAELLLYQRRPDAAEQVLVSANLIYRAIMLNIRIFRWRRALELASNYHGKMPISHVDTVVGYRQKHLAAFARKETDPRFLQIMSKVKIDWNAIKNKEAQENAIELKSSNRKGSENSVILKVIVDTREGKGTRASGGGSSTTSTQAK